MYHIPSDKRAERSAAAIEAAVQELIAKRDFASLGITDICAAAHVSRATFYRLFDMPIDVLRYGAERVVDAVVEIQHEEQAAGRPLNPLLNVQYVFTHYKPFEAVVRAGRVDIIFSAARERMAPFFQTFVGNFYGRELSPAELNLYTRIIQGILTSTLIAWIENGHRESPQQIISRIRDFSSIIYRALHTHE